MGVDVADLFGNDSGIGKRRPHGAHSAIRSFIRRRDVESIARHSVANNLRQDGRAALDGEIQSFQNHHAGAFANYKSVAALVRSEEHTSELQSPMYLACRL